jgi:hypothetical protein
VSGATDGCIAPSTARPRRSKRSPPFFATAAPNLNETTLQHLAHPIRMRHLFILLLPPLLPFYLVEIGRSAQYRLKMLRDVFSRTPAGLSWERVGFYGAVLEYVDALKYRGDPYESYENFNLEVSTRHSKAQARRTAEVIRMYFEAVETRAQRQQDEEDLQHAVVRLLFSRKQRITFSQQQRLKQA